MRKLKQKSPAPRISLELREEMFSVFQETQSENQVRKRCKVHPKTVRKYRERDKWDVRVEGIQNKVQEKLEKRIVNRRMRNVQVLDMAIEDVLKQLLEAKAKEQSGVVDPKLLARLVVAQDHLIGRGAADEEQQDVPPEVAKALEFLSSLGERALVQLAEVIAQGLASQPEGPNGDEPQGLLPSATVGVYSSDHDGVVKRKPKARFGKG
jgi:hypothetical protein